MELIRKKSKLIILLFLISMALSSVCVFAANSSAPAWMTSGGDAEQEISNKSEKVFKLIMVLVAASGAIGLGLGLAEINGIFGTEEKGPRKIKIGILTMVGSGMGLVIVSFFTNL